MSGGNNWTPGPWVADGFFVSSNSGGAVGHDIVSACGTCGRPDSETEANAQLIASAPDLYEALEDMLSGWKYIRESHGDLYGVGWDRAQNKARAALAKARGESK